MWILLISTLRRDGKRGVISVGFIVLFDLLRVRKLIFFLSLSKKNLFKKNSLPPPLRPHRLVHLGLPRRRGRDAPRSRGQALLDRALHVPG